MCPVRSGLDARPTCPVRNGSDSVELIFAGFGNVGPSTLAHIGLTGEVLSRNAGAFVEALTLLE